MDGEGPEEGDGDVWEVAAVAAPALRRWIQKYLVERTLIRPGAAGKLEALARRRPRHRGAEEAEGEAGGREAAAAAEVE